MTIVGSNIAKVFDPTDATVYTTASITLPANTVILLGVMGKRSAGASTQPTIGGTILATWTQIATDSFSTIAVPVARCVLFRTFLPSPQTGTITATFAATQDAGWLLVDQLAGATQLLQAGGSSKADATTGRTVGGFNNFGVASAEYSIYFITVSEAISPGGTETKITEQQGGVTLEAGTVASEYLVNTTSDSMTWAAADGCALGAIFGSPTDDNFEAVGAGSLLDSRRGAY